MNHQGVYRIQRSSTCVISLDGLKASLKGSLHWHKLRGVEIMLLETYDEHFPVDFADVLGHALPWPSLRKLLKHKTLRAASTIDKYVHYLSLVIWSERRVRELLSELKNAGFSTNLGIDDAGALPLLFARGGGMYIGISRFECRKRCSNS